MMSLRTAGLLAAGLGLLLAIVLIEGRDDRGHAPGDAVHDPETSVGLLPASTTVEQSPQLSGVAGATEAHGVPIAPLQSEASETPRTCRVHGRVIGPAGGSAAGARVVSLDRSGGVLVELAVAPDGSFGGEQPLPEGSQVVQWIARVQRGRQAWASALVTQAVKPGQDVGLVLYLQPASSIRVSVICSTACTA